MIPCRACVCRSAGLTVVLHSWSSAPAVMRELADRLLLWRGCAIFLLTGPRECLNVQRGLALSWSWSPPFLVLSLHLGVSFGPIDYGEDPGILSAGAFSCLLARRGYPSLSETL